MPCTDFYTQTNACAICKKWWCELQGQVSSQGQTLLPSFDNPSRAGRFPIPEDPWAYDHDKEHKLIIHKR